MTFREAFLVACEQNPKALRGNTAMLKRVRNADPRRPIVRALWRRAEKKSVAKYERETGQKVTAFDGSFLTWLMENLPAILQAIMSILALFGA